MKPANQDLLRAIRSGLQDSIAPALESDEAKDCLTTIELLLNEMQFRMDEDQSRLAQLYNDGARLLNQVIEAPPSTGKSSSLTAEITDASCQHILSGLAEAATQSLSPTQYQEIFDWEARYWRAGVDFTAPTLAPETTLPDCTVIQDYLIKKQNFSSELIVTDIKTLAGGFSRKIYLITVKTSENTRKLVARCVVEDGLLEGGFASLEDEAEIMRTVKALMPDFPVPEVYCYEPDTQCFGHPFLLMDFADGAMLGSSLGSAAEISQDHIKSVAYLLAELHRLPWHQYRQQDGTNYWPAREEATLSKALKRTIEKLEQYWRSGKPDDSALIEKAFIWLHEHLPRSTSNSTIVHTDIGFHNILFGGAKISALLDWEVAHLGSPAEDFACAEPLILQHSSWEQFIGWYCDAGGEAPDPFMLDYCRILQAVAHNTVCHVAMTKFSHNPESRAGLYRLATQYRLHFEKILKEKLMALL